MGILPELVFDPEQAQKDQSLKRADLLESVLAIAGLDHVSESELVRRVIHKALGHVPRPGD